MTSRIVGYIASPIPEAEELELLAFDAPEIEAFVRVWFGSDTGTAAQFLALLRQNPQVQGLGRIPLMLSLMCRAYQERWLAFPTRRVELYNRCLRGLLHDWRKEEKGEEGISASSVDAVLELLQKAAYSLFLEGKEQFRESELRRKLLAAWPELPLGHELRNRDPTSVIAEIKRDGILTQVGDQYDPPLLFLHRTFHEYLTACYLDEKANTEGWKTIAAFVDQKAWLPEWQEVIVLLAGQLSGPRPLLKLLTDKKKDDCFRHRLTLAALCLPEIPPEIRGSESRCVDRITTAAFSLWWECRINDIEAAVPHLTLALPALGQVNGRMEGTPLLVWLSQRLRDENWIVRETAAWAVEGLGTGGHPRAPGPPCANSGVMSTRKCG